MSLCTTIPTDPNVRFCLPMVLGLILLSSIDARVFAQVAPITSSGLNTTVTQNGNTYNITGGTRPGGGGNLFHSFGQFNVPNNNIANFLNETGLPTSNILGRVTGGNISSIFGTIQTTGFGNANLFLMNPAGFLFGPNATVNVGGMVAFTSANYIRLADGARFNAVPDAAADALLSTAPVAAYGFLGSNPGAITVQGSQFTVTDGTGISLVGGNITIQSGTPDGGTPQPARLIAPNGTIQLASATSPGEFDAATLQTLPNVDGASFTSFGSISLAPGSNINISGANHVSIQGGQFVLSAKDAVLSTATSAGPSETILLSRGSSIVTSNSGPDPGADIQLMASDISMDGASITSLTTGDGRGGNISVTDAQTITLTNGAQIVSSTSGGGDGGNITLSTTDTPASSVTISGFDSEGTLNGVAPFGIVTSGLFTTASSTANGGNISIASRAVTIENGGTGGAITSGDGHGGNLAITADTVDIRSGGTLESFNGFDLTTGELVGIGQGGNISITAAHSMKLSGFNPDLFTLSSIFSQAGNTGKAGDIAIAAPTVILESGGNIGSFASGGAPAGSISITALDSLSIFGSNPLGTPSTIQSLTEFGEGGHIDIRAGSLSISDRGFIQTGSFGTGNAGDITLQIDRNLSITGGGIIASFGGAISSGNIAVKADTVTISGVQDSSPSRIENINGGEGVTGTISINARDVVLTDNARINSEGKSGIANISILATDALTVSNGAKIRMVNEAGSGGLVELSAPTIMMQQGIIQTEGASGGDAGNVTVHADNLTLDGSFFNAVSGDGIGRGGDVNIGVTQHLSITGRFNGTPTDLPRPAGIYTETGVNSGFGNSSAGNISITAGTMALSEGATISSNTFTMGNAGNLTIQASLINIQSGATITSGSLQRAPFFEGEEVPLPTGRAGNVTIQGTASPAQSVLIDGAGSGIFTDTQGSGAGGNIFVNANAVTLSNGGMLSATTSGSEATAIGGTITVTGHQIEVLGESMITTQTFGPGSAGQISVTGDSVHLNTGLIFADTFGDGNAGSIEVQSRTMTMEGFSAIGSSTFEGAGNAGSIQVRTTQNLSLLDSGINSLSDVHTSGNSGQILISSPTINLDASVLSTSSLGHGNAGAISLDTNLLTIANGGSITSSTSGEGLGGTIGVHGYAGAGTSSQLISLSNAAEILTESTAAVANIPGQGHAGSISLATSELRLTGNSRISAETRFSRGNAGSITVDANEMTIASNSEISSRSIEGVDPAFQYGNAGAINLRASNATVTGGGFISTSTETNGNAGAIVLKTGNLNISDGGLITSSSAIGSAGIMPSGSAGSVTIEGIASPSNAVIIDGTGSGIFTDTQGKGAGGNIFVNANSVTLQNGGRLSATTSGTEASATGGTITVNANQFQLASGGLITASTTGAGAGGSITIGAGSTFASNAGTVSSTAAQATGGDINIDAGSVTLDNGSLITASSNGAGNAGNILINAGQSYTSTNSSVSTKAEHASGGNITVLATGMVHLTNSELNASVEGSQTTVGGNILIDPVYVILQNSQIVAKATQGTGGNINIFYTGALLADPSSIIDASSQFGQSGTVTFQSPNSPASGKIVPLGKSPLLSTALLTQRCAALAGGNFSSFTIAGRDTLPAEPGGWLYAPLTIATMNPAKVQEATTEGTQTPLLSLRQIAPPGFLTQAFAKPALDGCSS